MMGEAQKLTADEARLVVRTTLRQVAGEVPVVVGVSSPGLANLAALTSDAMSLGAAAVMVAPPSGLATDEQIEGYLHQLCEAIGEGVPVVLQDYPQATGVHLSVACSTAWSTTCPRSRSSSTRTARGSASCRGSAPSAERDSRRRIAILVGNGALYYPLELARGADGAMTGFAYPEVLVEVYERFAGGRREDAFDLYDAYLPLIRYEQQPGIGLAIRKEILHRRGVIACPALRPPGARLDAPGPRRARPPDRTPRAARAKPRAPSEASDRLARSPTPVSAATGAAEARGAAEGPIG